MFGLTKKEKKAETPAEKEVEVKAKDAKADAPEAKEVEPLEEGNKLYELGFNLVPTINDKVSLEEFNKIKEVITKSGGKVVSDSEPAQVDLAYTMEKTVDSKKQKYNSAYFGWVRFTAESQTPADMKEELDAMPNMLRYLLIVATNEGEISAQTVASMVNGEEEELANEEEEKKEEAKEEAKEEKTEEAVEEKKEEDAQAEKEKAEEIDGAIDDLVKEEA